jgi:hypothetical protein
MCILSCDFETVDKAEHKRSLQAPKTGEQKVSPTDLPVKYTLKEEILTLDSSFLEAYLQFVLESR